MKAQSNTRDYSFTCHDCGIVKTYRLEPERVERWRNGERIQNVFPEIDDREIMISQTCTKCFDELFADEDGAGER